MKKLIIMGLFLALVVINPARVNASEDYSIFINEIAEMYELCPELLEAVIYCESGGNPYEKSSHGAIGLMQIIPKWNRERMEKLGVTNLYDPYQNILVGADILAEYSTRYDVYEALAAYNCGEYSKTFKAVQNGAQWGYSDKVLEKSAALEAEHGK